MCVCVCACVRACVPGLDARLCSVAISLFPFLNNFYFLHFFMTTSSSVTAEFTVEVGLVLILPDLFSVAESIYSQLGREKVDFCSCSYSLQKGFVFDR